MTLVGVLDSCLLIVALGNRLVCSLACKLSKDSLFGGKYLCKVDNSLIE